MFIQEISAIDLSDTARLGAKAAGLGYLTNKKSMYSFEVPHGFVITIDAYWYYLQHNNLQALIDTQLATLAQTGDVTSISTLIYTALIKGILPSNLVASISDAYKNILLSMPVGVRSSSLLEDSLHASCAGQQETYLNVSSIHQVLEAYKKCLASLFNQRSLQYRLSTGKLFESLGMAVIVQHMVPHQTSAGVAFSVDPYSGNPTSIVIEATQGLGDRLVQGQITPYEYRLYKPLLKKGFPALFFKKQSEGNQPLSDEQAVRLSQLIIHLEQDYQLCKNLQSGIDVEWAYSSHFNSFFVLQIRPETVHAHAQAKQEIKYTLTSADHDALINGHSVGRTIVHGVVKYIKTMHQLTTLAADDIVLTRLTHPDWVPFLKNVRGIITQQGGRTCHAAIVSRELGIPALLGAHNAFDVLQEGQRITLDCSQGSTGFVYQGWQAYSTTHTVDYDQQITLPTQLLVTLADPLQAERLALNPYVSGVGLARTEFIIAQRIGIHPQACTYDIDDPAVASIKQVLEERMQSYQTPSEFFINTLGLSIATIAAYFYPKQVIVRFSDFKTNEYAHLVGGDIFEQQESNPMMGFRGALRYYSQAYKEAFILECKALDYARHTLGFDNIQAMIPFVRTPQEAQKIIKILSAHNLVQGVHNFKVLMMIEIPSNIILFEEFAPLFDGFSIGSNDLTQFVLAVDRDNAMLSDAFNEQNPAVIQSLIYIIEKAKKLNKYISICGQAPSDYPILATLLVKAGIDSLSVNPDSISSLVCHFSV